MSSEAITGERPRIELPRVEAVVDQKFGGRVYVVVFPTPEDVTAEQAKRLIPPLEEASKQGALALVIDLPPLRAVDPNLVALIISAMSGGRVNANIVGVVSRSMVVRVALRAIQTALKVYGREIEIATHDTRHECVEWAARRLAGQ